MIELPSFTFVPGWLYTPLFNWMILLLILITVVKCNDGTVCKWNASKDTRFMGGIFVVFLVLYIGLRPTIWPEYHMFVDTFNYKGEIEHLKRSWLDATPFKDSECLYSCIRAISAAYADEHLAFLVRAIAYVGCSALFCQRTFAHQWFIPFLMICAAFTFFAYGANGVRNGMAASMAILAFSYREGFGNVIIEAAAMGTPATASDIPGPIDAIISNETGILIQKANTDSLRNAISSIICSVDNSHFSSNHIACKTASRFESLTLNKEI